MNLRRVTLRYLGWCPGVKSASKFIPDREVDNRFIFPVILLLSVALLIAGPASITRYRKSIEPPKIGEARVFREEKLSSWQTQSGSVPYARYGVDYRVVFYSESDIFVLRDKIVQDPETSLIGAYSHSENSKIHYNATDGGITIEIIEPHKTEIYRDSGQIRTRSGEKYEFDIHFNSTPVSKFVPGFGPEFSWEPNEFYLGQDTDIEVVISPFKIQDTMDLQSVVITAYIQVRNKEITYLSSSPEAKTPSENSCLWAYNGSVSEFGEHRMKYHAKIGDKGPLIVFSSRISLNYRKPLYIESDPSFEGADADFGDIGSTFSYGFTYRIEDEEG